MVYKNYLELIINALPPDIDKKAFLASVPENWIKSKPRLAAATALRKCSEIDWYRYTQMYLQSHGMDPCQHFLESGVFEGNILCRARVTPESPLVSIIIANYNLEMYLEKCLDSALSQTLENIEIILIDDDSVDDSVAIARAYAQKDNRVALIELPSNMSQHMGRKYGIAKARGKYVMFMDADDFLDPQACEIAYNEISRGYDCVDFNIQLIDLANSPSATINKLDKHYNSMPPGEVFGRHKILEEVFVHKRLTPNLWNKIFRADHCKTAFQLMEDGYFPGAQDLYEFIAIASNFKSLKKITDRLYFHGFGLGFSNPYTTAFNPRFYELPGDVVQPIRKFCNSAGISVFMKPIEDLVLGWSVSKWLNLIPNEEYINYLQLMLRQYGVASLIDGLVERLGEKTDALTGNLRKHFEARAVIPRKNGTLAIVWPSWGAPHDMALINELGQRLGAVDMNIKWILPDSAADMADTASQQVVFFSDNKETDKLSRKTRLKSLYAALKSADVGAILYIGDAEREVAAWDLLTFNLFDVPVFLDVRNDFDMCFGKTTPGDIQKNMELTRCADALFCHSRLTETFFRINGAEAYNVGLFPAAASFSQDAVAILAWDGALGATSEIERYLHFLKFLLRIGIRARLNLLADYTDAEAMDNLSRLIFRYNLGDHCTVYNLESDLDAAINASSLLLTFQSYPAMTAIFQKAAAKGLPLFLPVGLRRLMDEHDNIIWYEPEDMEALSNVITANKNAKMAAPSIMDSYVDGLYRHINAYGSRSAWEEVRPPVYESLIQLQNRN